MAGGGAGSIMDMINRIRNNNSMLRRKRLFDLLKEEQTPTHTPIAQADIEATPEQLALIRKKMKRQRIKGTVITLLAVAISIYITREVIRFLFGQ